MVHLIAAATSSKEEMVPVQRSTGEASRPGVKESKESRAVVTNMVADEWVDGILN